MDTGEIDDEKVSCRAVFDALWKCRDFELTHCWQRSVFLTAFLIACFAGYGHVILSTFDGDSKIVLAEDLVVNGYAFVLSLIGTILSVFWIQMSKASKAWYECYEKAIVAFSDQPEYFGPSVGKIAGFKYRDIPGYKSDKISNWLWSTAGGGYSPSKINIAIGHLSLLIWIIASVVHLMIAVGCGSAMLVWIAEPAHMGLLFTFVLLGVWLYSLVSLKGRWLNEADGQKAGHFEE